MSYDFTAVIAEMMMLPRDPNESIPIANRQETMVAVSIPFLVLSWVTVGLRLHTRFCIVRQPGIDDLFVVLASLFNLVSLVAFLLGSDYGIGSHLIDVFAMMKPLMQYLYVTNAAYHTTTAFVKVSLLCQYLRMFTDGPRRITCIVVLCFVVLWGAAFSFMAWVPCLPVSGFWNRLQMPPPKCFAFGYRTIKEAKYFILAFAASNMFLDIVVFLIPLTVYLRPGLNRKQILAMSGLFVLGAIVVLLAVLRLWSIMNHSATDAQSFDFTWWYPQVLILSCLEIDFAIMCASMPIFWPTVIASWDKIFVTKEVQVTHHQRLDSNVDRYELGRTNSAKSYASTTGLTESPQEHANFYQGMKFDAASGNIRCLGVNETEIGTNMKQ